MCLSIAIARPDAVLGRGTHAGFEWMITHNGLGYRCGYVRIPLGHPWHGQYCNDVHVECHGGLTFSEPDVHCDKPGKDDAWWLGFDCAHYLDAPDPALPVEDDESVAVIMRRLASGYVVRSQEYVEAECRELCEQAAAIIGN